MQIIVHGGAGSEPDDPPKRQTVLDTAAERGEAAATPVDAVESAISVLERSPRFNAGTGGAVQSDGSIRTDAGLMTSDRTTGAVSSMTGVENAVSVARVVMERTPHICVAGDRAVSLAEAYGIETDVDLWSDRSRNRWSKAEPPGSDVIDQLHWLRERYGQSQRQKSTLETDGTDSVPKTKSVSSDESDGRDHDTVGAVARDGDRLAAATSTGGRWYALAGRVGDVPQIGSGFFCTPAGGVSATGAGEDIARVTLSREVIGHLEDGMSAQVAADLAIDEFESRTDSQAGVIVIDARGNVGSSFNTSMMQIASSL